MAEDVFLQQGDDAVVERDEEALELYENEELHELAASRRASWADRQP